MCRQLEQCEVSIEMLSNFPSTALLPLLYTLPRFFVMPGDAEELKTDLLQNPGRTYIKKPVAMSRGRGVAVIPQLSALDLGSMKDVLLQHYIDKPFLINGLKFDLRVYVAVTCLDPLRLYVHEEGRWVAGSSGTGREWH